MSEPTKPPSPGPESPAPGGEDEDYSIREALARIALQACQEALQESGQQHRGDEHGERARTALELARASIGPPPRSPSQGLAPGSGERRMAVLAPDLRHDEPVAWYAFVENENGGDSTIYFDLYDAMDAASEEENETGEPCPVYTLYACTPLAAPGSPLSKETPGRLHSAEAGTRKLDSAPGSHEGGERK